MKEKSGSRGSDPAGPQGTMIFRPGELSELLPAAAGADGNDAERPRLVGLHGAYEGRDFLLRRGRTLIGRRASNDIVLEAAGVSALHAWIVQEDGRFRVINALSTNGTFVNGGKVHEAALADGDLIRFGEVELCFRAGSSGGRLARLRGSWRLLVAGMLVIALAALAAWALVR